MRSLFLLLLFGLWSSLSLAKICPDPQTSSLQWGEPPAPWVENPFSPNHPQGEENTRFVRSNILVAGVIGRGVSCTYQNSVGQYSIWWPVRVKIPSQMDNHWIRTAAGYVCSESLSSCVFYVAEE
ncbi:DUF3757 domain-containing protein [Legionella israelensis]|uniref:DUF3757 domain-containing protein n=1 Tax=Legionella israelensis TaxID=454 RepID=A0A0W0VW63_9GAMM|nr:DUF3757 domain-containing protein [Legionella israelensis]KTD24380.1 hypothetical protein Lisr_1314 [Legionella israelensis]QBR84450.1 DUF3757 domain-containing protein [Legionella israelensis]QBS08729.1 DUF3757 domain-containing protein [Legionella israelensis]QDP72440.1 DUF3757 domain-containing protein [Legionella israelensis]SCY41196.1 Protein of unknown function [Legionella israelensis DSM 19235]